MGFSLGEFPLKYLGVPPSPTKWKKGECQSLVEKITVRVRSWATRHLSYAGRAQLRETGTNAALVSWTDICFAKTQGGLGFRRCTVWNQIKQDTSWHWKKLIKLRDKVAAGYQGDKWLKE
eukprot:TRINITY_DN5118_c0_g1_i6.p2 TRINITY_DN5118_c0_g1~~TRINITY_DN5118_c0_g1_i6.p2  ORF type:complete len:120 (+),score=20.42 TRINITY_DN5118_c0_g1_i6:297-656(+)